MLCEGVSSSLICFLVWYSKCDSMIIIFFFLTLMIIDGRWIGIALNNVWSIMMHLLACKYTLCTPEGFMTYAMLISDEYMCFFGFSQFSEY